MRKLLATLAIALVAACTTTPQTPQQAVYAIQGSYAGALTVAVAYKRLPPCGRATSPTLCADPVVVAKLQKADDLAYPTLQTAQNLVRMPDAGVNAQTAIAAARQAVGLLVNITNTLTVK